MCHRNFGCFPVRVEHALHKSVYPFVACLMAHVSSKQGSGTQWSGEYQCISNFEVAFCEDSFRSRKAIDGKAELQLFGFRRMPADQAAVIFFQCLSAAKHEFP